MSKPSHDPTLPHVVIQYPGKASSARMPAEDVAEYVREAVSRGGTVVRCPKWAEREELT